MSTGYEEPTIEPAYYETVIREDSEETSDLADDWEDDPEEQSLAGSLAVMDADPEAKALNEIYKLEKSDPKHRMGNFLLVLQEYYQKIKPPPRLPFFSWVDALTIKLFKDAVEVVFTHWKDNPLPFWSQKLQEFQRGVKYKGPGLLAKYLMVFQGGILHRVGRVDARGKWVETKQLQRYSTAGYDSHWSGGGWGIWVESRNKLFYSNRMKVGRFQHSSFLAGKKVAGAGEWQVDNGVIKKFNGRSGHYQPGIAHMTRALHHLRAENVAHFDQILVVVYTKGIHLTQRDKDNAKREIPANAFLSMSSPDRVFKADPGAKD